MNVEVEGLEKFVRDLEKMIRENPKAVMQGLLDTGFVIQKEASEKCPVRTGRLRSSIAVVWKGGTNANPMYAEDLISQPENDFEVWIGTKTFYAVYVEFGTSKMKPKPYLRPAFENNRHKIAEFVKREIGNG